MQQVVGVPQLKAGGSLGRAQCLDHRTHYKSQAHPVQLKFGGPLDTPRIQPIHDLH